MCSFSYTPIFHPILKSTPSTLIRYLIKLPALCVMPTVSNTNSVVFLVSLPIVSALQEQYKYRRVLNTCVSLHHSTRCSV